MHLRAVRSALSTWNSCVRSARACSGFPDPLPRTWEKMKKGRNQWSDEAFLILKIVFLHHRQVHICFVTFSVEKNAAPVPPSPFSYWFTSLNELHCKLLCIFSKTCMNITNKLWGKRNTSFVHLKILIFSAFFIVRDYRRPLSTKLTKWLQLLLNIRQSAIKEMQVS